MGYLNLRKGEKMYRKEHMLLKYAVSYKRTETTLTPNGCIYDFQKGAWIVSKTGVLLVNTPKRPKPQSKKADIETGEDQKGE